MGYMDSLHLTADEIVVLLEALASGDRLDHGAGLTGLGGDDHTQYQKESEKDAANGYAGLDASSNVVESQVPEHMAKGKLAWTLNKILKGAGAGSDPTEIDVPTTGASTGEKALILANL